MLPKLDPSHIMDVFVRVTRGEVVAVSSLAPKKTGGERDRKTKNIKHTGNISLDDVIEITRVMRCRSVGVLV